MQPIIVVAEDDDMILEMTKESLAADGLQPLGCKSGEEALELISSSAPDLVILDLELPGISGIETCIRIRTEHPAENLPVIIATGYGDPASISVSYEAGATDFVVKPIIYPILIERIRHILRAKVAFKDAIVARSALEDAQRLMKSGSWERNDYEGSLWLSQSLRELFAIPVRPSAETDYSDFVRRIHPEDRKVVEAELRDARSYGKAVRFDHRVAIDSGHAFYVRQHVAPMLGPDGIACGLKGVVVDRTDEARASMRATRLEQFNMITGLPNRNSLVEVLKRAIESAVATDRTVAVICFELDRAVSLQAKLENERFHTLIRSVGARLMEAACFNDSLGRSMGLARVSVFHSRETQFATVVTHLDDEQSSLRIARHLHAQLGAPFHIEGSDVTMASRISGGLSILQDHGSPPKEILRSAERALQHAKAKGGDRLETSSPELNQRIETSLYIESHLADAIRRESLSIEYQPVLESKSNRIVGVESLVRWPDSSPAIGPSDFIPVAESTAVINPLGEWVLREACSQGRAWHDSGHIDLRVSVNVSPYQLQDPSFIDSVQQVLRSTGFSPKHLELEIAEGVFCETSKPVRDILRGLRRLGIRLAVDDFGTGYTSLQYLLCLPFDTVKLNRTFIDSITSDPTAERISAGIINLAHSIGMRVVAEGVETTDQLDLLRRHNCDEIRGFAISPPLAAEKAEAIFN